jgi:hypothetical protein
MKKNQITEKDKLNRKIATKVLKTGKQIRPESFIISFKEYLKRDRRYDAGK